MTQGCWEKRRVRLSSNSKKKSVTPTKRDKGENRSTWKEKPKTTGIYTKGAEGAQNSQYSGIGKRMP